MRKTLERECYWCEDCQREIPLKEQWNPLGEEHADHEVVKITVFGGWQIHILNKVIAELNRDLDQSSEGKER